MGIIKKHFKEYDYKAIKRIDVNEKRDKKEPYKQMYKGKGKLKGVTMTKTTKLHRIF